MSIIRAIPQWAGAPEMFYNVSELPWKQVRDIREELGQQGFFVQDIHPIDPMPVLVAFEIRRKFEEEQVTP